MVRLENIVLLTSESLARWAITSIAIAPNLPILTALGVDRADQSVRNTASSLDNILSHLREGGQFRPTISTNSLR